MCQHMGESRAVWASHKLAKNPIRARLIAGERGGGGDASWEDAPWKTLSTVAPEVYKPSESERGAGGLFFFFVFFFPSCSACCMRGEDKEALRFTGNPAPFIRAAHNGRWWWWGGFNICTWESCWCWTPGAQGGV